MYKCCRHCNHTGNHVHEIGWKCEKHDFFVNWNDKKCVDKVFECTDCRLSFSNLFQIGVYADDISVKYVLEEYSESHNEIMVYYKEGEYPRKPHVEPANKNLIVEYIVCFDDFPVFRTEDIEEIEFIKKGFNFQV